MDGANNAMSQILHGCKLAKDLEAKLPYLENQPHALSSSCEEITKTFQKAMKQLNSNSPSSYDHHGMFFGGESSHAPHQTGTGVPQEILSGFTQATDNLHSHAVAGGNLFGTPLVSLELGQGLQGMSSMMGYVSTGDTEAFPHSGSSGEFKTGEASDPGTSPPGGALSTGRSRNRKETGEKRIIRVPAPREGNMEIPPDDGFTWRKYGQKEILNSRFPRSYYRCTHRNFYGCDAKKQVQRLDDDPFTFEVTYRGHHSCQAPAPTALPILPTSTQQGMLVTTQEQATVSTSIELASWFSTPQLEQRERERNSPMETHMQTYRGFRGTGESSTAYGESSSHAGGGKEMESSPVEDFAEFMFNSGSSGSSIDAIFSTKKED